LRKANQGALAVEESKRLLHLSVSEQNFQFTVVVLATTLGWNLLYHTYRSDKSAPGFFDLVLINERQGRIIFAELKSEAGVLEAEQYEWGRAVCEIIDCWSIALGRGRRPASFPLEYYLWRPSDMGQIEAVLTRHAMIGKETNPP
jgi:hypothetical protein